jgi:parallel beta-helix repeat protein
MGKKRKHSSTEDPDSNLAEPFRDAHPDFDDAARARAISRGDFMMAAAFAGGAVFASREKTKPSSSPDPVGDAATIVVAANSASLSAQWKAAYVCDGTADDVEIQAAVDALPSGGGKVVLSEGTFTIGTAINLKDNVTLAGAGYATVLNKTTANDVINVVGTAVDHITGVTVQDLRITCPSTSDSRVVGKGIDINFADHCVVRWCWVTGFGRAGDDAAITLRHALGCEVTGCYAYNALNGILTGQALSTDFPEVERCLFANNVCYSNWADGIHPQQSARNVVIGNICYSNMESGIDFLGDDGSVVVGNKCYGNTLAGIEVGNTTAVGTPDTGLMIVGNACNNNMAYGILAQIFVSLCSMTANTCRGNAIDGIGLMSHDATKTVDDCVVSGNILEANGGQGILIQGAANRNLVIGNVCRGNRRRGIRLSVLGDKTPTDNAILDNYLSDNVAEAYRNAGRGTKEAGNIGVSEPSYYSVSKLTQLWNWSDISLGAGWTKTVAGSGAVSFGPRQLVVTTDSTAGSTAVARTGAEMCLTLNAASDVIDWSKPLVFVVTFSVTDATTDGIACVSLGKAADAGVGEPAVKSFGLRVDNLALKGLAHDGTSLTVVDLNTTLVAGGTYQLAIVSDGAGNVEWFLSGTLKGTTTAGPRTVGAAGDSTIHAEVSNGANSVAQRLVVSGLKYAMSA